MDLIIFFKAVGNLLFAAILFFAIAITSVLSVLLYIMKGFTPSLINKKDLFLSKIARNR